MQNFQVLTRDIWWDLRTDEDVEKVGVEVQSTIENKLLPFLDSVDDFRKLHDVFDKTGGSEKRYPLPKINFALLKNSIGDKETAVAILKDLTAIAEDTWTDHAKRALRHVEGVKKSEAI